MQGQCWNPVTWVETLLRAFLSTEALCWVWAALGAETWVSHVSTGKVEGAPKALEEKKQQHETARRKTALCEALRCTLNLRGEK